MNRNRFTYARMQSVVQPLMHLGQSRALTAVCVLVTALFLGCGEISAQALIISEFRLSGPGTNGSNSGSDEFIEIYNNSDNPVTVQTTDSSGGYALAIPLGWFTFIPDGTVIPARGHYLVANSNGYSLTNYPAGNGTSAAWNADYSFDIDTSEGIALFNTLDSANFNLTTRLDAVGPSNTNALYREGAGYAPLTTADPTAQYSFVRDTCGKGGNSAVMGACPSGGLPRDTGDNAADFFAVTDGANIGGPRNVYGSPAPENLSSPIVRNAALSTGLVAPCLASSASPNRVRDTTPGPEGSLGTLELRRRFTNTTGAPITRLRFRVIDISTGTIPAIPPDIAILDTRTSTASTLADPCNAGGPQLTIEGTTLEPVPNQFIGGGLNTSLSPGTVTLAQPLAAGASINLKFRLGVEQNGRFKLFVNVEALP